MAAGIDAAVGKLVAGERRARGLTLSTLAASARVGRSTLAAFEAGKLSEPGYGRVARIRSAVDVVLEARPLALAAVRRIAAMAHMLLQ